MRSVGRDNRLATRYASGLSRALWLLPGLIAGFALGVAFQRSVGFRAMLPASAIALLEGETAAGGHNTREAAGADALYGKLSLFVLAGQSNMSGRGELPPSQASHPSVVMFGNDYRWRPAIEPVDDATRQVDVISLDGPGDPHRRSSAGRRGALQHGRVPGNRTTLRRGVPEPDWGCRMPPVGVRCGDTGTCRSWTRWVQ
jgi:hypothetical protein